MQLTVLTVPDCPNLPALDDRLAAVLDGRADVSVSHEVISSEADAARRGMHGSLTLLIDGADPFAARGQQEITGGILGQDRALQVGIGIFGQLLS
jgi:hypothetical protein